jgi:hypothetical protein
MFKKEKLYKIVYEAELWHPRPKTLIVVATDPVRAMKQFYKIVTENVRNITEFIEIRPKMEGEGNIER